MYRKKLIFAANYIINNKYDEKDWTFIADCYPADGLL